MSRLVPGAAATLFLLAVAGPPRPAQAALDCAPAAEEALTRIAAAWRAGEFDVAADDAREAYALCAGVRRARHRVVGRQRLECGGHGGGGRGQRRQPGTGPRRARRARVGREHRQSRSGLCRRRGPCGRRCGAARARRTAGVARARRGPGPPADGQPAARGRCRSTSRKASCGSRWRTTTWRRRRSSGRWPPRRRRWRCVAWPGRGPAAATSPAPAHRLPAPSILVPDRPDGAVAREARAFLRLCP